MASKKTITSSSAERALQKAQKQKLRSPSIFEGTLGPLSLKAQQRPSNYILYPPKEQWHIDDNLGILDWSGKPITELEFKMRH